MKLSVYCEREDQSCLLQAFLLPDGHRHAHISFHMQMWNLFWFLNTINNDSRKEVEPDKGLMASCCFFIFDIMKNFPYLIFVSDIKYGI